jgi:hypothetical protein
MTLPTSFGVVRGSKTTSARPFFTFHGYFIVFVTTID